MNALEWGPGNKNESEIKVFGERVLLPVLCS